MGSIPIARSKRRENYMEWYHTLIVVVFLIGFPLWSYVAYRYEKDAWNKGICPKTGKKWVPFDVDSQGGRGYKSESHHIWISYPGVDSVKKDKFKQPVNWRYGDEYGLCPQREST